MTKLSLLDIAKKAGCSTATVSNVLNKKGNYGKDTEKKILKIIKDMDYSINFKARMLRTGKTQIVGVVFYRSNTEIFSNEYYLTLMHSLQKRLAESNYELLISEFTPDHIDNATIPNCLKYKKVDGAVLLGGFPENAIKLAMDSHLPTVILDSYSKDIESITTDGAKATFDMTKYAIGKGSKKLFYFAYNHDDYNTKERQKGFCQAVDNANVEYKVFDNFDTDKEACLIFDSLLQNRDMPDTILACNDNLAIALMNHAIELGISIPKDVSFFGYDSIQMGIKINPTLSTAVTDTKKMGIMGADAILEKIKNPSSKACATFLEQKIEIRHSSF